MRTDLTWARGKVPPRAQRLTLGLGNVERLTVDMARAGLHCGG